MDTTFFNGTVIQPAWLNSVNSAVYDFTLNVKLADVAATGNGIADDTVAIQTAIDTGLDVFLPEGIYRTTQPLVINKVGQRFFGQGNGNNVQILADHLNGPVIQVKQRQCHIFDLLIYASDARNNGAVDSNNHGIEIGGTGAGTLTATKVERVVVSRQPADAFHMVREGVSTIFSQCFSQYNRGHGFFFDDGTYDGLTPSRTGIVTLTSCRSVGDGGYAVALGISGFTAYRYILDNFEAFDNAWNNAIVGLTNNIYYLRAQNIEMRACAAGDANFAATVNGNGDTRLAKGAAATGIQIASFSSNICVQNFRAISLTRTMNTGSNIKGIYVNETYSNTVQSVGYNIGASCTGLFFRVTDPASYTIVITKAAGTTGKLFIADTEYTMVANSSGNFALRTSATSTVVADSVNCLTQTTVLSGEGGVADDISQITFAGGGTPLPDGEIVYFLNLNAYNLTFKHGVTNVFTATGADVVLGQNRLIGFVIANGGKAYQIG